MTASTHASGRRVSDPLDRAALARRVAAGPPHTGVSTQSASTGDPSRSPRRRWWLEATIPVGVSHARTRIVSPGKTTPAKRAVNARTRVGVAAQERVGDLAQDDAVGAEPVQDRRGEAGGLARTPGRRAAGCGRRRAGRAAPAAASRRTSCRRRDRGPGARPGDGRPAIAAPAALAAHEDRRADGPQLRAAGGDDAIPSCQITAALPLSQTSEIRVRTVAEPLAGHRAGT